MKTLEERLEDVSIGLSVPIEKVRRLFSHMESKGRVNSDDIRHMEDLGLNVIKEVAELKFRSYDYVSLAASVGKLSYYDIVAMIEKLTNEGGVFYKPNEYQAKSLGAQYERIFKEVIINAYKAGYEECENKGMREYSAEQYFNETFSSHLKQKS